MYIINKFKYIILSVAMFGCSLDELVDPNQPGLDDILNTPTEENINLLVLGLEGKAVFGWGGFITATGQIGRELYDFNSSDPTTLETLLGKDGQPLTGSEPQLTGTMFARYQAIKSADFILDMADRVPTINAAQAAGYRGVALTFKGYMLLDILNMLGTNGVRVDIADIDNLGPFLSEANSYAAIRGFLDDGYSELQGSEFLFQLSTAFDGYDTPTTFAEFNRAIAARVANREGDYAAALNYLNDSFLDLAADSAGLMVGPERGYSDAGGTQLPNPIFKTPQQNADQYVIHNRFINNIQAGDTRINKFRLRNDPTERDGLSGTHEIALYSSIADNVDHIRNEELVLIYAEANFQEGNAAEARTALNAIRSAYGLADVDPALAGDLLRDEILYNRRYSLFAEGHTWFDVRKYDLLGTLPIDRPGDLVHVQFPIPPFEVVE